MNEFTRFLIAVVVVCCVIFLVIKVIIPIASKVYAKVKVMKQKEQDSSKNNEAKVELSTKSYEELVKSDYAQNGSNYQGFSSSENLKSQTIFEKSGVENLEVNKTLKRDNDEISNFFNRKHHKSVKTEIKKSSSKMKAIMLSGVLDEKKYDE